MKKSPRHESPNYDLARLHAKATVVGDDIEMFLEALARELDQIRLEASLGESPTVHGK